MTSTNPAVCRRARRSYRRFGLRQHRAERREHVTVQREGEIGLQDRLLPHELEVRHQAEGEPGLRDQGCGDARRIAGDTHAGAVCDHPGNPGGEREDRNDQMPGAGYPRGGLQRPTGLVGSARWPGRFAVGRNPTARPSPRSRPRGRPLPAGHQRRSTARPQRCAAHAHAGLVEGREVQQRHDGREHGERGVGVNCRRQRRAGEHRLDDAAPLRRPHDAPQAEQVVAACGNDLVVPAAEAVHPRAARPCGSGHGRRQSIAQQIPQQEIHRRCRRR